MQIPDYVAISVAAIARASISCLPERAMQNMPFSGFFIPINEGFFPLITKVTAFVAYDGVETG